MSSRERQVQLPLGEARPSDTVASPSAPSRQRERQSPRQLELGQLVMTPGARAALDAAAETPFVYLKRHASGDWGTVDGHDRQANRRAIRDGDRVLSAYRTRLDVKLWVITEHDRSSTCVLLPEEY